MNRGADQFASDVARQLSIRIERDHVTNCLQQRVIGSAHDEARISSAAQESIEFFELASLSFPTHPFVLAGVPLSPAMKEMKAAVAVTSIQCVDTALSDCEQM